MKRLWQGVLLSLFAVFLIGGNKVTARAEDGSSDEYYFFSCFKSGDPDSIGDDNYWIKTTYETATRKQISSGHCEQNEIIYGMQSYVYIYSAVKPIELTGDLKGVYVQPKGDEVVDVTINGKVEGLSVSGGNVVLNGNIVENVSFIPGNSVNCNLTVYGSIGDASFQVYNDTKNTDSNLIVHSEVKNGYYWVSVGTSSSTRQYFSCDADTQLVAHGVWNKDVPIRLAYETSDNAVSVQTIEEDELAKLAPAEGIGGKYTLEKEGGDKFVIVKRAGTKIQQIEADAETAEGALETIQNSGAADEELYSVAATLEIDLNTWFENLTENNSIYSDDKYTAGKITQLSAGKTLTIPFQIANYDAGAIYKVVRIHRNENNNVTRDVLDVKDNGGGWLSFESDRFSTFVVIKIGGDQSTDDKTGTNTNTTPSTNTNTTPSTRTNTTSSAPSVPAVVLTTVGAIEVTTADGTSETKSVSIQQTAQGEAAQAVIREATPEKFTQAMTFNLLTDAKATTDGKRGEISLDLKGSYGREGRTFALIGIDKNGAPHVYADLDDSATSATFKIDIEGYAFALIYSDDPDAAVATETGTAGDEAEEDVIPAAEAGTAYRLYNAQTGEHYYTVNVTEANALRQSGWAYEGTAWRVPDLSGTPVYGVKNPNTGENHYTMDVAEKDALIALGWVYQGIAWYSDDEKTIPVYRVYNPNEKGAGAHHYTTDAAEQIALEKLGWKREGIAWYAK